MKREIIIGIFILFLVGIVSSECDDSDGGLNYYTKGTVDPHCEAPCGAFIDTCLDDNKTLIEYYCENGESNTTTFTCPDRCEDGACIEESTNETCAEDWSCDDWSDCVNNTKTRTCTDLNDCNTTDDKPSVSEVCEPVGDEDCWQCGRWSECVDGERTRTCSQISGCTSDEDEPKTSKRCKERLRPGSEECPEDCTCTGSVTKCYLEDGRREMTVRAGKSGNVIVQVKGVNMSTKVTLYKNENGSLIGVFKGKEKVIKVLPDGVKEKLRQRIRARLEEHNITLDEDGIYQVQLKKKARLFFIIPVKQKIKTQISSETGEIIKIRNSWWGFLARDIKDNLVGGCGTVTPGMEDECCQNLGYDFWNSEELECE